MSTPTLRWLQIHQYEQFEPVRIDFSPQENLILGLNGAGKTQLLKLIWAVLSLSLEELGERDLHIEFELAAHSSESEITIDGMVRVAVALTDPSPEGPIRPEAVALDADLKLRVKDRVLRVKRSGRLATIEDEQGRILAKDHEQAGLSLWPRDYNWEWNDPELAGMETFEDMNPRLGCCSFSATDFEFGVLTSELGIKVRQPARAPRSFVRVDAVGLNRIKPRLLWDLAPTAQRLAVDMLGTRSEADESPDLRIDASEILAALGAAELRLSLDNRNESSSVTTYRGMRLRLKFRSGADVPDSELTFGQRRYVYAALVSSTHQNKPIVCDEVDNGMHPRLVRALLGSWTGRQMFLSSHNKLVIDSTNFLNEQDIREKIHIIRRREDGRQVVKVFDELKARELYKNIEVGLQSPSDVLEAEGLW